MEIIDEFKSSERFFIPRLESYLPIISYVPLRSLKSLRAYKDIPRGLLKLYSHPFDDTV
jgi:hypothetical protein